MTLGQLVGGFEARPHWWEASALTAAPTQLSDLKTPSIKFGSTHFMHLGG